MLIVASMAINVCRVYTCGDIKQTEGETDKCVKKDTETGKYLAQACSEKDKFCQAWKWEAPTLSEDIALCETYKYAKFSPKFIPVDGKGLDGDYCEVNGSCFSSENNKATCEHNVCTASTSAQSPCGVDNDCPIGFRCDTQKCAALKTANTVCGSTLEYDFGTTCVKKDKDTEATCIENWSLKMENYSQS